MGCRVWAGSGVEAVYHPIIGAVVPITREPGRGGSVFALTYILVGGRMTDRLRNAYNINTCWYGVGVPYQADQFTELSLAARSRLAVE